MNSIIFLLVGYNLAHFFHQFFNLLIDMLNILSISLILTFFILLLESLLIFSA